MVPLFATALTASAATGDWPQWRGPERDGHAADGTVAPTSLIAEPRAVWRLRVGGGFSSPVVAGGKLVYLDEDGQQEVAHLIDAESGKETWRVPYAARFEDEWGPGPRSTPIIDGDRVYVQSCNGVFRCLRLSDGKTVWGTSFEKDFGVTFLGSKAQEGTASRRGNNGCGIVDGPGVIVPVGSTNGASLVCFDKLTGAVVWKSGSDEAAYSSLMIGTFDGVRQVVAFTAEAILGADRSKGTVLWRVPLRTNAKRHTATPVINGATVTVNSHTIGLLCYKISRDGGAWKTDQIWGNPLLKINLATPVLVDQYLYSHGQSKNFVCVDSLTGKQMWAQDGFGKENSSTLAVGKNLLVLTDEGQLVLIAADSQKYRELGRAQVCGKNWNFPAFAAGKLYVRDSRELICFALSDSHAGPSERGSGSL